MKPALVAAAVEVLKNNLAAYKAEAVLEKAKYEYAILYRDSLQAQVKVRYLEGDDALAVITSDAAWKQGQAAERSRSRIEDCQNYVERLTKALAKDGGKSLATRWYTSEGQEAAEGLADGRASVQYERAAYG